MRRKIQGYLYIIPAWQQFFNISWFDDILSRTYKKIRMEIFFCSFVFLIGRFALPYMLMEEFNEMFYIKNTVFYE